MRRIDHDRAGRLRGGVIDELPMQLLRQFGRTGLGWSSGGNPATTVVPFGGAAVGAVGLIEPVTSGAPPTLLGGRGTSAGADCSAV